MHMASSPWAKPRVLGCGKEFAALCTHLVLSKPFLTQPSLELSLKTANTPLSKGNLNAPATGIVQQPLLPLLLPQKFTNGVTDGSGSRESISALLQFVLS